MNTIEALDRPGTLSALRIPADYTQVALPADAPHGATLAFSNAATLVIIGKPDPEDEEHNCDGMGCRQDHVLERRKINLDLLRPQANVSLLTVTDLLAELNGLLCPNAAPAASANNVRDTLARAIAEIKDLRQRVEDIEDPSEVLKEWAGTVWGEAP